MAGEIKVTNSCGDVFKDLNVKPIFDNLRQANFHRNSQWDSEGKISLSFRGNEFGGECGELQNVLKKIERAMLGLKGSRATIEDAKRELGDVVICADLIAMELGIDLDKAVEQSFNDKSEKHGFDTRLKLK